MRSTPKLEETSGAGPISPDHWSEPDTLSSVSNTTGRFSRLMSDRWISAGIVAVLAVVVYIPAFWAAFVWDDSNIVELPNQVNGLGDIWFNPSKIAGEGHYWPLTYTTFWIEHLLWGTSSLGSHVVNVLMHAANSLLVLVILRKLVPRLALVSAAVFAVHPIHVDSVAWAIERKDVLSGLLYLYAAWAYIVCDQRDRGGVKVQRFLYVSAVVAFAMALFSKSIVVTLPASLLLYHWWRNGRLALRDLIKTLPFVVVSAVITVGDILYYFAREGAAPTYSIFERAQIISTSFWHYVQKILWPESLIPLYPRRDIDATDVLGWSLFGAAVALVLGLWFLRHKIGRGPLAGLLFFGITLAPNLGVVDYGYMDISYVADRFAYLASIGLIALAVGAVRLLLDRLHESESNVSAPTIAMLCMLLLGFLGFQTWSYTNNYASVEKFFRFIVENNPTARGGAYTNLANQLMRDDKVQEAIVNYEKDLVYSAGSVNIYLPYFNLGVAHEQLDNFEDSEKNYLLSIESNPTYAEAYTNLGNLLVERNRFDEASGYFDQAISLAPNNPIVISNYSRFHELQGDFEQAETILERGIETNSEDAQLQFSFGRFLYNQDRFNEAEGYLQQALALDAEQTAAAEMLATLLLSQGRRDEAQSLVDAGYLEALEPATMVAEIERGNSLLSAGDAAGALDAYDSVLDAEPENTSALIQRAVALENLDRPAEALESYRQAYEIDDENISGVYFYALLSARLEDFGRALELFDEAEALFMDQLVPASTPGQELPTLVDVYVNRPFVLVNLERLDEALADIERALELDPGNELAAHNREQIQGLISQQEG